MGIRTHKARRQQLIFGALLLMPATLFISRAGLSIAIFLFVLLTCIHKNFLQQLFTFLKNPFLLGISFLFFIPFISGFWSSDKQMWLQFVRLKLPLFLLPVAFAGNWQLSAKQWRLTAYSFLIFVFTGCCWSLWRYAQNIHRINESYLKAKLIATPLENDHVRFSLVVCIAVICSALLIKKNTEKFKKIVLIALTIFFVAYLHILSARTGLMSLYFFFVFGLIYIIMTLKKPKWAIPAAILIALMPVAAWFLLPTFQNRVNYILYDLSYTRNDAYLPGANDGSRVLSLQAGWDILKQHPFGVGSGDIIHKTNEWYRLHVPGMLPTDKYYPSSEWLLYGDAAGWFGVFLFTVIMVLPFFEKIKADRFFWISLNSVIAFSLMFDIGLEVQFGVFIYAFIILWWWKWLRQENNIPETK